MKSECAISGETEGGKAAAGRFFATGGGEARRASPYTVRKAGRRTGSTFGSGLASRLFKIGRRIRLAEFLDAGFESGAIEPALAKRDFLETGDLQAGGFR